MGAERENDSSMVDASLREAFIPTGKSEFTIKSGGIFIGDPFYLGFPREIMDQIEKILDSTSHQNPVIPLPCGVLVQTVSDMSCNVYTKGSRVLVVNGEVDEKHGQGRVFTAGVDCATMFVGDAEVYTRCPIFFAEQTVGPDLDEDFVRNYNTRVIAYLKKQAEEIRAQTVLVDSGVYKFSYRNTSDGILTKLSIVPKKRKF